MHTIKIDNKSVVFLNHAELIKIVYNTHSDDNQKGILLRRDLFDFHAKEKNPDGNFCKKSRKRKALKNTTVFLHSLQEQNVFIQKVIEQLKTSTVLPEKILNRPSLTSVWESAYEVPQLHGNNATRCLQTVKFKDNYYLIPPNCTFFNYDVTALPQLLPQLPPNFDLIVLDPPWRNKYIRRLKRARQELGYQMLDNAALSKLPIANLVHRRSIVAIWCTNSQQHQTALSEEFLPAWNLRLLHVLKWMKLNTDGDIISPLNVESQKQPYEMLYLACHKESEPDFCGGIRDCEMLLSIPSIVHSHKPPLNSWLDQHLPLQPNCLELFARYLLPGYTSIGLEVLKLMNKELYQKINKES